MTYEYVDLFPDDPPRGMSPMDPGGIGLHFMYWSNRNVCSLLHTPREVTHDVWAWLLTKQPMGYSTMFVLEKLGQYGPGAGEGASEPDVRVVREGAKRPVALTRFCAFIDPELIHVGGGALRERHSTSREAYYDAQEIVRKHPQVRVLTCRVVTTESWH